MTNACHYFPRVVVALGAFLVGSADLLAQDEDEHHHQSRCEFTAQFTIRNVDQPSLQGHMPQSSGRGDYLHSRSTKAPDADTKGRLT